MHPKWHPQRRWLKFEDDAAVMGMRRASADCRIAACSGEALKIQPAPPGMPFGVHIDVITSMANLGFGGIFFAPQVPPAPRCTPVVISTKLTSRLSLAPCCAGQPSFCHIQAAPRRALLPLDSFRRRYCLAGYRTLFRLQAFEASILLISWSRTP